VSSNGTFSFAMVTSSGGIWMLDAAAVEQLRPW
jgi:hypothetical protein